MAVGTGALLAGTFVACSLLAGSRPIGEITVHVVDCLIVACFGSVDGVDGRWYLGVVHLFIAVDMRDQLLNVLLEVIDRVVCGDPVDASPFEVRVVSLVGGRMIVMACDDA